MTCAIRKPDAAVAKPAVRTSKNFSVKRDKKGTFARHRTLHANPGVGIEKAAMGQN